MYIYYIYIYRVKFHDELVIYQCLFPKVLRSQENPYPSDQKAWKLRDEAPKSCGAGTPGAGWIFLETVELIL